MNETEQTELLELKRKYLFDDKTGMMRDGIDMMSDYVKILGAEDEDELNKIILGMLEDIKPIESIEFEDVVAGEEE